MKLQDNVRAVVVKEVQLRDPVLTGALHCCSRASPSTSSPTFNLQLPTAPPQETTRRPQRGHHRQGLQSERQPLVAQRTMGPGPADLNQRGHHRQGLRSERRAARRPTDYGARARAGGTCLVAVLHAASVIGCWGCATGARVRLAFGRAPDAPPPHLMMLAASRTSSTRHRHSYQHTITLAAPAARPQHQHPMTLAACNTATRHVPPALALAP